MKEHPTIDGIYEVEYRLPALNNKGEIIIQGIYRWGNRGDYKLFSYSKIVEVKMIITNKIEVDKYIKYYYDHIGEGYFIDALKEYVEKYEDKKDIVLNYLKKIKINL